MRDGISHEERQRRQAVLRDVERRVAEDGPRVSRHYPERARQFMPFAALRGYSDMVRQAEGDLTRVDQRELTEEECLALSETMATLRRGDEVTLTVYDQTAGSYEEISGCVDEVVEPLGTIRVSGRWIPFDRIGIVEIR